MEEADEIDGIEAALLVAESRIDELTQVMAEEIDNLRTLVENLEEDLEWDLNPRGIYDTQ